MKDLQDIIEKAWEDRSLLNQQQTIDAIREVVRLCDQGILRCAEPSENGWKVNQWVKKGIVLYWIVYITVDGDLGGHFDIVFLMFC